MEIPCETCLVRSICLNKFKRTTAYHDNSCLIIYDLVNSCQIFKEFFDKNKVDSVKFRTEFKEFLNVDILLF